MTSTAQILVKVAALTEEQRQQVVAFLRQFEAPRRLPLIDPYGMFAGQETTEEDIAEARREMWGIFPREDF
jgi:hypothetical protein